MSDIGIEKTGHVALVEIRRPPNNFFDIPLIKDIAGAFESFDEDSNIRAIVLAAQGKAFCAGANFGDGSTLDAQGLGADEDVSLQVWSGPEEGAFGGVQPIGECVGRGGHGMRGRQTLFFVVICMSESRTYS